MKLRNVLVWIVMAGSMVSAQSGRGALSGSFTRPVERHMTWELAPDEEILESICNENNKFLENAGIK